MDRIFRQAILLMVLLIVSLNSNAKQIKSDPTRPGVILVNTGQITSKKSVKAKTLLSAIFIKQGKRQAIINNKLYQQGDYFSGKKIIAIKSNKVVLQSSRGVSNLMLIQPVKKLKKP